MSRSRVARIHQECPEPGIIDEAAAVLRRGGLVVYPTDTLYGLGADPHNAKAVERVYKAKERERDKPLPVLLAEGHYAVRYAEVNTVFWKLATAFWPGPLTIVAPARDGAPRHLVGDGMIGLRLPRSPVARVLAASIGGAIVGTSANKSGMPPPRTVQEAMSMLGESVELYLDGGPTRIGAPSTVVVVSEREVRILREGAIPAEKILSFIGK